MKKFTSMLAASALVLSLAACSSNPSTSVATSTPDDSVSEVAAGGTVVITHEKGETEVAVNPEKVLVMDYGLIDMLDTVGIEIGGVPNGGSMPAYLSSFDSDAYLNTGTLKEIDYEAVNEYGPDLIIITGRLSDSYDECSKIAPTVYMPMPSEDYLTTMQENVATLGLIFPDKADELQAAMQNILSDAAALKAEAEDSELSALVLMTNDGNFSIFGTGSRYGIIHDDFGFVAADADIDASTHGEEAGFEYIQMVDPDIIFVIDRSAAIGTDGASGAAELLDNDLVNTTSAAQNGRIIYLSSDVWYLASGGFAGTSSMITEVRAALD